MPKRGNDADSRIFFDELVSLTASRLKATGAIRLEDRHGFIAFGDEDVTSQMHRRRPYEIPQRRLMELFHLSAMWRQEKEALARRRCATLPELLLVLRRALSLGLWLRPNGAPERARSLR